MTCTHAVANKVSGDIWAMCLMNSQKLYATSSSGFCEAVVGCREATFLKTYMLKDPGSFLRQNIMT